MSGESALGDAQDLTRIFHGVVQAAAGTTPIGREEDRVLDALCFKILAHVATAIRLGTSPTHLKHAPQHFYDVASAYAVARTAYESCLVLHHLFLVPDEVVGRDRRAFRLLRWRLHGCLERTDFNVTTPHGARTLREDLDEAARYRRLIAAHSEFEDMTPRQQRAALTGDTGRDGGWRALATEMGIPADYHDPTYALLCAYAHSGALSAGQLANMRGAEIQRELVRGSLRYVQPILARAILAFARRFPSASAYLHASRDDLKLVEMMAEFAEIGFTFSGRRKEEAMVTATEVVDASLHRVVGEWLREPCAYFEADLQALLYAEIRSGLLDEGKWSYQHRVWNKDAWSAPCQVGRVVREQSLEGLTSKFDVVVWDPVHQGHSYAARRANVVIEIKCSVPDHGNYDAGEWSKLDADFERVKEAVHEGAADLGVAIMFLALPPGVGPREAQPVVTSEDERCQSIRVLSSAPPPLFQLGGHGN